MKNFLITIIMLCMGICSASAADTFITITSSTDSRTWKRGDGRIEFGTMTYDKATKTLTLDGLEFNNIEKNPYGTFLCIKEPGITVILKNTNIICSSYFVEFQTAGDANFKMVGTLKDGLIYSSLYHSALGLIKDAPATFYAKNSAKCKNTIIVKDCGLVTTDFKEELEYRKNGVGYELQSYLVRSNSDDVTNDFTLDNSVYLYQYVYNGNQKRNFVRNTSNFRLKGCSMKNYPDIKLVNGMFDYKEMYVVDKEMLRITQGTTMYGVSVDGYDVNSINKDDVLGNGNVSYDPATNTLKLAYGSLRATSTDTPFIKAEPLTQYENYIQDFNIEVLDNNTLTNTTYNGPMVSVGEFDNFNIKCTGNSAGTLALQNYGGGPAIQTTAQMNLIEDCSTTVKAVNGASGIEGNGTNVLRIKDAYASITGASYAVKKFLLVMNDGCDYIEPTNLVYDITNQHMLSGGKPVKTLVLSMQSYGIKVNGVEVASTNKSDVLGNGMVSYWPESKRLYLKGASIVGSPGKPLLEVNTPCDIYLEDGNLLLGKGDVAVINNNVRIFKSNKDASLGILGTMAINNSTVQFNDVEFNILADGDAIHGSGTKAEMEFNNSKSQIQGAVSGITNMTFENCAITTPHTYYHPQLKGIMQNGELKKGTSIVMVEQCKSYGVRVDGTEITSLNETEAFADGKIKYVAADNTLLLNEATLQSDKMSAIYIYKPMTIGLVGTNNISVTTSDNKGIGSYPLEVDANVIIRSKGTRLGQLVLTSDSSAIHSHNKAISIADCALRITGDKYAWTDDNGSSVLVIKNSNVALKAGAGKCFRHLGSLSLSGGTALSFPKNVRYNASTGLFIPDAGQMLFGITGDINGDGKVSKEDVNSLMSIYLNARTPRSYWRIEENADINGDGKFTMYDVNAIMNMVLAK